MASLIYNCFRQNLLKGIHNVHTGGHTVKVCLVNDYTVSATHTVYADVSDDEVSGDGYTTGGATITSSVGGTVTGNLLTTGDVTWSDSTITATGAVIYDVTASNALIAYLDFGGAQQSSAGNFTLSWTSVSNVIISIS